MAPSNPPHQDLILHEILPRLPVKSLLRFKCVSKLWESTISDPNFELSDYKSRLKAACVMSPTGIGLDYYSMDHEGRFEKLQPPSMIHKFMPKWDQSSPVFMGSCNGLVLASAGKRIFLWNPSTSYCEMVLRLDCLVRYFRDGFVSGFLFDPDIDDYRVEVLFISAHHLDLRGPAMMSATFKSKKWETMDFPYKPEFVHSGPAVNGRLHWAVKTFQTETPTSDSSSTVNGLSDSIMYLDWSSKGFREVPLPEPMKQITGGEAIVALGELDGCLCMMTKMKPETGRGGGVGLCDVVVYAMKEYGVQESWTKILHFANLDLSNCYNVHMRLLTSIDDDDDEASLLFDLGERSQEVIVNYPCSELIRRRIQLPYQIEERGWHSRTIPYKETLVSPKCYP